MGNFKMTAPYKIDPTSVHEVPFDNPNLLGKANKNGTIIINNSTQVAGNPKKRDEVVKHEKHHLKEMIVDKNKDGSPKLDYDADSVSYKGVKYPRSEFDEGNKGLPWEKDAYGADKDIDFSGQLKTAPKMIGDKSGVSDEDEVSMGESFGPANRRGFMTEHRGQSNPFKYMEDKGLLGESVKEGIDGGPQAYEDPLQNMAETDEFLSGPAQVKVWGGPSLNGPGDGDKLTVRDIENQDKSIKNAYRNFTGQNATFSPSEVNFGNNRQYRDADGKSMIESDYDDGRGKVVRPFSELSSKERDQFSKSRQKLVDDAFWDSDAGKEYLSQTEGTGRYFNTRSGEIELAQHFEKPTEASQFWEGE